MASQMMGDNESSDEEEAGEAEGSDEKVTRERQEDRWGEELCVCVCVFSLKDAKQFGPASASKLENISPVQCSTVRDFFH